MLENWRIVIGTPDAVSSRWHNHACLGRYNFVAAALRNFVVPFAAKNPRTRVRVERQRLFPNLL